MWLITLLILAIAAFFIVKYMKSQTERKRAEQDRLGQSPGIEGSLGHSPQNTNSNLTGNGNSSANPGNASAAGSVVAGTAAAGAAAMAASASMARNSGHTVDDVREMIKILNFAEPDAKRLAISPEQLRALRNADTSAYPDEKVLDEVAKRLRKMLD